MREAVCVVWSRRRSRAVSAVAAGVGRGVGRAFLLAQMTETENAVFSAVVVCAGASRAVSLAGVCGGRPGRSMGSGLRECWGSQLRWRRADVM
jgi:hypothetical protein